MPTIRQTDCTLNGKPATIIGKSLPYAIVATIDGSQRFEWSWQVVARIMASGGRFTS